MEGVSDNLGELVGCGGDEARRVYLLVFELHSSHLYSTSAASRPRAASSRPHAYMMVAVVCCYVCPH